MGYKKYSPFVKSVKILILISLMYFTSRLDAITLPGMMSEKVFNKLPVYCAPSTRHFECVLKNGTTLCLPDAMKCKQKCENDAELNCSHAETKCRDDEYRCKTNKDNPKLHCIPKLWLCDGLHHCPLHDDENPSMCANRQCGPNEFSCVSAGHCIAKSQRCDGKEDCRRDGLKDLSDEQNCVRPRKKSGQCPPNEVSCFGRVGNYSICGRRCDQHVDCTDGSDERDCPKLCTESEFKCDGKCLAKSKRCNGYPDCSNSEDEKDCKSPCQFSSDKHCFLSPGNRCIKNFQLCDETKDCPHGEDEICPVSGTHSMVSSDKYWTCKSGAHRILKTGRCDGHIQCPDGSDELNCPKNSTAARPTCPPEQHQCQGAGAACINLEDACKGKAKCPEEDPQLTAKCKRLQESRDPCNSGNGGCAQLCKPGFNSKGSIIAVCSCRAGWNVSATNPKHCIDINECERFGACSQLCHNEPGNYSCSCRSGYAPDESGNCAAHGAAKILFSTKSSIDIVDTVTRRRTKLVKGLHLPKYIAFDSVRGRVFFHTRDAKIGVVGIDGNNLRYLATGQQCNALAYDWARDLLFYTVPRVGSKKGYLGLLNPTTGHNTKVRTLDCPHGLAVNPQVGELYVSLPCGDKSGIYRVTMDSFGARLLLALKGLPSHVALDLASSSQRLYWIDTTNRTVDSATLSGQDQRSHLAVPKSTGQLFDLAVFEDNIYWSNLYSNELHKTNKYRYDHKKSVINDGEAILSVTIYHSVLQPKLRLGSCADCHQLCVPTASGSVPTCLCDSRYKIMPDNRCVLDRSRAKIIKTKGSEKELSVAVTHSAASSAATASKSSLTESETSTDFSSFTVMGIVIALLAVALLISILVAIACNSHLARQTIIFHHSELTKSNGHGLGHRTMPKVNSRTPLTECEIDLDQSRF